MALNPPPRAKRAAAPLPTPSPGSRLTPNPPSPSPTDSLRSGALRTGRRRCAAPRVPPSRGRGRPQPSLLALSVLLALLAASSALLADAKDSYKRGMDAIEQQRWDEAAKQMRQAIAEKPDAAGGIGNLFRRYTPHYWLGVALAEQGDCRSAIAAFDTAEKQGKLSKEESQQLTQRRQLCHRRVQRTGEAVAQAQRDVDAAAAAAFAVAGVESSAVMRPVWREGSPSFATRQEPATAQLAAARTLLARAEQELDADKAAEAGKAAQAARRDLDALLTEATARREALQAEVDKELAALAKAIEDGRRRVSSVTRTLTPLPAAIAKQSERVEEALTRAAAADPSTPVAELKRLQEALKLSLRELQAAVKPPPEELQRAAGSYLAGDYAAAITTLSATQYTEPRAAAHACLLRAASLHGLYLLQAAQGDATLQQAREELRRCTAMRTQVKPIAAAFPPSFLALYAEVAAEPRPTG